MNEFDLWNEQKKHLQDAQRLHVFFEREVWIASLGNNIGREINGKHELFLRPVLVYRKYNSDQCFVFPLTTKGKENIFYYNLSQVGFLDEKSFVCLSQGRVIDSKRLFRKLGIISVGQFQKIQKAADTMLTPQLLQ